MLRKSIFWLVIGFLVIPAFYKYESGHYSAWISPKKIENVCADTSDVSYFELVNKYEGASWPTIDLEVSKAMSLNHASSVIVSQGQCVKLSVSLPQYRWKAHALKSGEYPYLLAQSIRHPEYLSTDDVVAMILAKNRLNEDTSRYLIVGQTVMIPEWMK